jgi:hypothetical protein
MLQWITSVLNASQQSRTNQEQHGSQDASQTGPNEKLVADILTDNYSAHQDSTTGDNSTNTHTYHTQKHNHAQLHNLYHPGS